ncbi:UNVERIFIED_CONTAM: hypothetical protein HDU68_007176 [Siphonaria sp. JEL0065]|nr:hypothetical protein HDU68_007176 [Siphonaria sp. JEL0065]
MYAQLSGRKHHYAERQVQEDLFGSFSFLVGSEVVWGCYVCDGHGVSFNVATPEPQLSGAERFQALLKPVLDRVVRELVSGALETQGGNIRDNIEHNLEKLNAVLDDEMSKLDPHLCKENGSTLSLALLYGNTLFCCNIGDSQILMFDRDDASGKPLKVWKLKRHLDDLAVASTGPPGLTILQSPAADDPKKVNDSEEELFNPQEDPKESPKRQVRKSPRPSPEPPHPHEADTHTCSFPDSLFIQEGTIQKYISKEYSLLRERAQRAGGGGPMGGYIHSNKSRYRLGMTCSIGNTSHKDNLLVRTSVYAFDVDELLDKSIAGRILIVITSDGIKDLVKSHFIGQTFVNLPKAIRALSAASVGNIASTNRRPILTCMNDLIPRPTEDIHDRAAKEHLDKLISAFETTQAHTPNLETNRTSNSADPSPPPSQPPSSTCYTDTKYAVEALCDLAILKGSTDDITVAAFEIASSISLPKSILDSSTPLESFHFQDGLNPKDFIWIAEKKTWHVIDPLYCKDSANLPTRSIPKRPVLIQKLLDAATTLAKRGGAPLPTESPTTGIQTALKPLLLSDARTPVAPSVGWGVATAPASSPSALGLSFGVAAITTNTTPGSAIETFERLQSNDDLMEQDGVVFESSSSGSLVVLDLPLGASNMELSSPLPESRAEGGTGLEEGTPTRKRKGSESLARQDLVFKSS